MGATPHKAVTNCFPQVGRNQTSEAPEVIFDPTTGGKSMETPLSNDSLKASLSPPVGGRLRSFRRDRQTNKYSSNVLNSITNGYVLSFLSKPKSGQIPSDSVRGQGPSKRPSSGHSYPVSSVKERNRKGGKCKISRVLHRLFLVPKPRQRWRPVIDLSRLNTLLHVEKFKMETPDSIRTSLIPGQWISSIDLTDAYRHIPIHPNSRKYQVLPQVAGVPVHLPPERTSQSPPGLYNDCKGSEANGPFQKTQTSSIPGRLADQIPVSGGSRSEHSGSGRPNPVLGLDNTSGKIRTETYSGVFIRGLQIPSRFSPCKTHPREMLKLQDLIL